ncbi:RNA-directed DNA polymerase, eukaryota, reverse transcriptase zinc-binding domain protein [Tanacetum coccineum]
MKEYFKKNWRKQYDKDKNIEKEDNDDDTDIELDENDIYVDKSRTAKFMTENEILELGMEVLSIQHKFYCTFIYAANKSRDRRELWKELNLNKRITRSLEWVIMGDVNVSLNLEDHYEGMSNFTQDMINFQECINEIEMDDINSSGLHFTWIKSLLNPSSSILKKIDRMEFKDLVKEKWNLEIQGHHMYRLAKFYDSQRKIDMNPTDKALRIEGVELLKEDGRRFENCDVANQFIKHFEGLLGISLAVTKLNEDDDHLFVSKISEEEVNNMIREIDEDEIKKALFDIDDDKAPDDDLIMLCNGDTVSVKNLKKALDKFSAISGLYPNLGKCTMFCGGIDDETKENISKNFHFKEGKLPVRYLGVPLVTKKIEFVDCKQLVDKVRQKLSDWKNKSLSYAGRAQLIASVLGSMQVY